MKKLLLLLTFLVLCITKETQAQRDYKLEYLSVGPIISGEWNLYNWYQRPDFHEYSAASGGNRSVGQVLNVMPSLRLGVVFNFDYSYLSRHNLRWWEQIALVVEGGVNYTPFSLDLEEYKGQGAISFPINATLMFPVGDAIISAGIGVQFTHMEFNHVESKYYPYSNPFFTTYFVELGVHTGSLMEMDYALFGGMGFFGRFGIGDGWGLTLDTGLRFSIGLAV